MRETKAMLVFKRATLSDTTYLRSLARASEAHWGYDESFLVTFDQVFNITDEFITSNPVYVLWDNKKIIAFWGLVKANDGWELEYFYVSETELGHGYGKQMWNYMISWCREQVGREDDVRSLHFVTSPQAVGFYERMGAIQDHMVESVIDGRQIPHLVYKF